MDITVCSLLPYSLRETKPGLVPDTFEIPKSKDGQIPGVLHINNVVTYVYMGEGRTLPMTISSEELAEALVNDVCSSMLGVDGDAKPALFWVVGKLSGREILEKAKETVQKVKASQNRWFKNLIKIADDDWSRYKQHKMITDIQRYAAKSLGQMNKEWAVEPEPIQLINCPACKSYVEGSAIVCKQCNAILDKEKAKELGLTFAAK